MKNVRTAVAAAMALLGASVVFIIAGGQAPSIDHRDPSTWPKAPRRYVRHFSLSAGQHEIGLALSKPQIAFDHASWHWTAQPAKGTIKVSVSPTADGAREARFGPRYVLVSPKLYLSDGAAIGDVSWVSRPAGAAIWFFRRNVAVFIASSDDEEHGRKVMVRLARAVARTIDRSDLVDDPSLVRCPKLQVEAPKKVMVGEKATLVALAQTEGITKLTFTCFPTRPRHIVPSGPFIQATTTGKASFVLEAKEQGQGAVAVYVTDADGMTRRVEKEIQVLGDPRRPPSQRCPHCHSDLRPGARVCPHCGEALRMQ